MARQDPWSMAEAVILLDATLQYKAGIISRSEAVSTVSGQLRQMAQNKGQKVDEIYRNVNGISFQMASMESALVGRTIMKPATHLFEEAVLLYGSHPIKYQQILSEAQALCSGSSQTIEQAFSLWLASRIPSSQISDLMAMYEEIELFCRKINVLNQPLFETTDYSTVKAVQDTIETNSLFRSTHVRNMSLYYAAISHYCSFIEERNRNGFTAQRSGSEATVYLKEAEANSTNEYLPIKVEKTASTPSELKEINNIQACEGLLFPDKKYDTDDNSSVAATAEAYNTLPIEERIELFLKQVCERNPFGITTRYLANSFPNVSPSLIKFTLKKSPWAVMRNHRWLYRNTSLAPSKNQKSNKEPPIESSAEIVEINQEFVESAVERETKISFLEWLEKKGLGRAEAQSIDSGIRRIETWAINNGITGINLSSESPSECARTAAYLLRNIKFREYNAQEGNNLLKAISNLLAYCSENLKRHTQNLQNTGMLKKTEKTDTDAHETDASVNISEHQAAGVPTLEINSGAHNRDHLDDTESVHSVQEPLDQETKENSVITANRNAVIRDSFDDHTPGVAACGEFKQWLIRQRMTNSRVDNILWALAKVEEYAAKAGLISGTIYNVTSSTELRRILEILNNSTDYISYTKQNAISTSYAFGRYIAFREEINRETTSNTSNSIDQPGQVQANIKGSQMQGAALSSPIANTATRKAIHPGRVEFEEWLRYTNVPAGSIKTYAESVERIGKFMLEKGLEDRNIFSIRGVARLDRIREVFIESMGFTSGRSSATYSLDLYAFKKYTNFRKNNSSEDLDEEAERFSIILRDNFENGFRPNSIIDRNRFKQYYADQYGAEPTKDNDGIVQILRQIGTQQEDRIFFREGSAHSDLLDDIQAEIAHTFKSGASCIYCSELFKRYQEVLAAQLQVFNQDALKQLLLSTSYDEYYASKNCFCVRGVKPNADEDIRKLMRQSQTPMEYADIHRRLWYIPLDSIKYCLATTKDMVNVAQETYFYAPNLPVSMTELNQIVELLHGQLSQKSFVTDAELREMIENDCPSVAINTDGFSTWGLRDCLSVLLQDRFAFVGPIISEKGMALNMSQVFAEFSRSHDRMTFSELKEFAKSVNNGFIYWESVMEEMMRISRDEFVPKSRINFDVDATDGVLDELLDGDYAPIKDFGLFLHFPAVGFQWNEFLIESYVAGFSRQFSLMHSGYTATECCGGIVRKASKIKDFTGLVTDVLAHSNSWETQDDALSLLVNQGYLQRKHFSKIDSVVTQAKRMKEQIQTDKD